MNDTRHTYRWDGSMVHRDEDPPPPTYGQLCARIQKFHGVLDEWLKENGHTRSDDEEETKTKEIVGNVLERLIEDYYRIFEDIVA